MRTVFSRHGIPEIPSCPGERMKHVSGKMGKSADLKDRVIQALKTVTDPETSMDVWRMKLVKDLEISEEGEVKMTFRPSSVACPLGFSLAARIKEAVKGVEGISGVRIRVDGFLYAGQLEKLLEEMDRREKGGDDAKR